MTLYLAQFTLVIYHYPDREECKPLIRLVEADTIVYAEAALKDHYAKQNDPYSTSYCVEDVDISPVIR